MTSQPPIPPGGSPPGVPAQPPERSSRGPVPRESRGVSFFVAIFLGILLVASAGLNVLLLLFSVGSLAGGSFAVSADPDDGVYDELHVAGERGSRRRVLQIPITGAIAESQSALIGAAGGTVSQVKRALRQARAPEVVGVLLAIDSPGGGVTDSDAIYRLVREFRREFPDKKVVALFGDIAASGGYYVAAAAERIVARRTTITGSIGVIMSAWNFAEAAKDLGIRQIVIKSDRTPYKDMLSMTREMEPAERAILTSIVDELFDLFVTVVDEGRPGLDREAVLKAATGAVYTASQAVALGLVDEIGDLDGVVDWFSTAAGGPVAVVEHRRRLGLGDLLFGATAAPAADQALGRLLLGTSGPRFLYYWEGGR
jgi:protease IV